MGSFNAPVWLFRARLGFTFGHRVVVLEHTGRRSGRLRQTPLAVIRRQDNSYTVCSETGPDADWYRNIKANPATRMWVGSHRYDVEQRFLDDSEAATALARCETDHPKIAARLTNALGDLHDGTHRGRMETVHKIPMVEFRLTVG